MLSTRKLIKIIDGDEREREERAEVTFSGCKTYEGGNRVPKAGARCEAGVGRVRYADHLSELEAKGPNASAGAEMHALGYEASAQAGLGSASTNAGPYDMFGAEVKGPNVSVGAEANVFGVEAMARAEVGSLSANVGPISGKLGLSADTGVSAGVGGVEVKLLGTGFKFGPETSVSVFGSELSCSVM